MNKGLVDAAKEALELQKPIKLVGDGAENMEIIAAHIQKLADASEKMLKGGLTMKALTVLLHDDTKISKRDIEKVLLALPRLKLLVKI